MPNTHAKWHNKPLSKITTQFWSSEIRGYHCPPLQFIMGNALKLKDFVHPLLILAPSKFSVLHRAYKLQHSLESWKCSTRRCYSEARGCFMNCAFRTEMLSCIIPLVWKPNIDIIYKWGENNPPYTHVQVQLRVGSWEGGSARGAVASQEPQRAEGMGLSSLRGADGRAAETAESCVKQSAAAAAWATRSAADLILTMKCLTTVLLLSLV